MDELPESAMYRPAIYESFVIPSGMYGVKDGRGCSDLYRASIYGLKLADLV